MRDENDKTNHFKKKEKKKVYVTKMLYDTAAPPQDLMSFVLWDERFSWFQSKCFNDLKKTGMLLHT